MGIILKLFFLVRCKVSKLIKRVSTKLLKEAKTCPLECVYLELKATSFYCIKYRACLGYGFKCDACRGEK